MGPGLGHGHGQGQGRGQDQRKETGQRDEQVEGNKYMADLEALHSFCLNRFLQLFIGLFIGCLALFYRVLYSKFFPLLI